MKISRLTAESFRRFEQVMFEPHPHLTVLHGANASGKTSLLEAIYFASRANSFRARRVEELIREQGNTSRVCLSICSDDQQPPTNWVTAIQYGEVSIRRQTESTTRRELAQAIPVVLVDRQVHRVFEEGPVYRRRYIDWGLFYVEQNFFNLWRRHERVLRQRNQSLKQRVPRGEVEAWNPEFIATAEALHKLRQQHVLALEKKVQLWIAELLEAEHFMFSFSAGWNEQLGLQAVLSEGYEGDRKMGFTHAGPQRAELRVRFKNREARTHVSRGQQKMLAVAMTLAQAELVAETLGQAPILLLDDLEAELSLSWQRRLVAALIKYPGQSLVTSLEWQDALLPLGSNPNNYAVFHVEHGHVSPHASM